LPSLVTAHCATMEEPVGPTRTSEPTKSVGIVDVAKFHGKSRFPMALNPLGESMIGCHAAKLAPFVGVAWALAIPANDGRRKAPGA
jgi:hypothetical protein